MADLKPCPFCGSKNLHYDDYWCVNFDGYYVRCLNCNASATPKGTKRAARKAWNTRTPIATATEVKHGAWIKETEYYDDDYSECNVRKVFACSLCGRTEKSKQPYCNCGAIMDGKGGV